MRSTSSSTATGVKEATAILFRLNPGVTVAEVEEGMKKEGAGKDPNETVKYGSIVFDAEATRRVRPTKRRRSCYPAQYVALAGEGEGSRNSNEPSR